MRNTCHGKLREALQPMVAVALASSSGGTPLSWRPAIVIAGGAGLRGLQQRQRGGSGGCAAGARRGLGPATNTIRCRRGCGCASCSSRTSAAIPATCGRLQQLDSGAEAWRVHCAPPRRDVTTVERYRDAPTRHEPSAEPSHAPGSQTKSHRRATHDESRAPSAQIKHEHARAAAKHPKPACMVWDGPYTQ